MISQILISPSLDDDDQDKLLRLLVDKFAKKDKAKASSAHDTGRKLAQLALWCDMRHVFDANEATMGLKILDDIAEAIPDEGGGGRVGWVRPDPAETIMAAQESGGSGLPALH
ncbi:hypothetical protein PF011_g15589 [Phytophthora fragariae]|uniref:Uncharacterized protein n=1 Tax=Phytophthora fragariae TaxID=53985 RepID=A0A6A3JQP9_9STRA|nr:hypothetical protein PF011_g15589 [Phytophthora fragariae]